MLDTVSFFIYKRKDNKTRPTVRRMVKVYISLLSKLFLNLSEAVGGGGGGGMGGGGILMKTHAIVFRPLTLHA